MPSSQNGNIGLNSGYTAGDNGWTAQHNFNWDALDALTQPTVKSISTTTPPGSPANGDAYVVPAGATGAWASQTNKIAAWQRSAWAFYTPKNGWQVYNQADGGDYLYNGSAWALQGSQKLNVPQDYISGLKMVWNSNTSISVTTGAAYISSLGRLCLVNSTLTLSSLSLTASTWYHLYLYENAGTPTLECVTTAPAAAYYGTARAKTGDTSRRYVGSVRTDTSGNVMNFDHTPAAGTYHYKSNINNNGLFVLSNGGSATQATIDCTAVIPVTGVRAFAYLENTDTVNIAYVGTPDLDPLTVVTTFVRQSGRLSSQYLLVNQQMSYKMQGASAGGVGLQVWIQGYIFER